MLAVRLGYSIADSTGSSTQFTETPETHTYTNTGQEPTVLLQLRLPAALPTSAALPEAKMKTRRGARRRGGELDSKLFKRTEKLKK